MELNDLQGRFNLVSMLLSAKPNPSEALDEFQQLLKKDYMDYTKVDDALSEEAGALLDCRTFAMIWKRLSTTKKSIAKIQLPWLEDSVVVNLHSAIICLVLKKFSCQ